MFFAPPRLCVRNAVSGVGRDEVGRPQVSEAAQWAAKEIRVDPCESVAKGVSLRLGGFARNEKVYNCWFETYTELLWTRGGIVSS